MSLQVWLPLTKDLRQQGLSNISVTNNGATYSSTGGKLGGCYSFNRSTPTYLKVDNPLTTIENGVSMAFWVKLPSNASGNNQIIHIGNGAGWGHNRCTVFVRSGTSYLVFSLSGGSDSTSTQYTLVSSSLTLNTWTHVVCTYSAGKAKIYLNGVLDHEYTVSITPSFNSTPYIGIGAAPNAAEGVTCSINDVRIYDHCLSEKEIKYISQGLVLHYPLDRRGFGQENLLSNTDFNGSSKKFTLSSGSEGGFTYTPITNIASDTKYTVSCRMRGNANMNLYKINTGGNEAVNWINRSDLSTTDYKYFSLTFTSPSSNKTMNQVYICTRYGSANSQVGDWFEIEPCSLKLEKGEKATPWCPATTDTLYTTLDLNGTTEYDTSGFCNNGTRNAVLTYNSNTPKYSAATYFDGSRYITSPSGSFTWFDFNKCTIAAWMKPTTTPSAYSGSVGITHDQDAGHKCFAISNYGGKFTVNSTNGSNYVNYGSGYTMPLNEWHYYVATLDGTSLKMYVDGELKTTTTLDFGTGGISTSTRVNIAVDLPGTDEKYIGYYSDCRIYTTSLSIDDIAELYAAGRS